MNARRCKEVTTQNTRVLERLAGKANNANLKRYIIILRVIRESASNLRCRCLRHDDEAAMAAQLWLASDTRAVLGSSL